MIQAVTSQPNVVPQEVESSQKSPLWGRVNVNWDKVLLFSNTALILAGMAFLYFMKFAFLAIGVGVYGLCTTALYGLALRARVTSSDSSYLQKELKLAEAKLEHEQKKVKDSEKVRDAKRSDNTKLKERIKTLSAEKKKLSESLEKAKKKRDVYKGQLDLLRDQTQEKRAS